MTTNTILKLKMRMTASIIDKEGKGHIVTKANVGDLAVTVPVFKYAKKYDKLCKVVPNVKDIREFVAVEWITPGVQAEPGFYHRGWFRVEESKGNA